MTDEQLRDELNKARLIAVCLAENIYKYLGDEISKDELKQIVDLTISDSIVQKFEHLYIKKDMYKNIFLDKFHQDADDSE